MKEIILKISFFVSIYLMIYTIYIKYISQKNFKKQMKFINEKFRSINFFKKIEKLILVLEKQNIVNKKNKSITPFLVILISFFIFIISYILIYNLFKVKSVSIILSIPLFFIPNLILKILLSNQKNKILNDFPIYIINLKNNVSNSGDILYAIQTTRVNEPLTLYINEFNIKIKRGLNVFEAFEGLKENIDIKKIDGFLTACQICYLKGGNFIGILNQFSSILTKDNIRREKLKENSYSSIITLLVMFIINIYLIFIFVLKNKEYADIIRNTFLGEVILNFTAITYIVIGYLIMKIYRMEE